MSTTQLHITLEQMNEWASINGRAPSTKYKDIQYFISTMEVVPPKQLMKQLRRLVVDEGVDPEDIITWIMDEEKDEQHAYNIRLSEIFKLVYTPVVVDNCVLDGLI
jgi:hypothetical protein